MKMKRFLVVLCTVLVIFGSSYAAYAEKFPSFTSQTLLGETVTEDIFSGKRLTMVNIWTTWCAPCISEMPDLGILDGMMPEGTQLVGILEDAIYDPGVAEKARDIVDYANASFTQILGVDSMNSYLNKVVYIPTTIFIDSDGTIVGDAVVGTRRAEEYLAVVKEILGEGNSDSYEITLPAGITGGKLTLPKTTALAGEIVTFDYAADSGYVLESISAHKTGDAGVNVPLLCTAATCEFMMPAYPVTIEASFRKAAEDSGYQITAPSNISGGKVTLPKTTAAAGETVTFTYTPDSGYVLESISAHKTGDASVSVPLRCVGYTCDFVMPAYPVTIEALFRRAGYIGEVTPSSSSGGGGGGCSTGGVTLVLPLLGAVCAASKKRLISRKRWLNR
jgi:thiol-disulfide isomerase/thioredoxin